MKSFITIAVLLITINAFAQQPISITTSDMPVVGNSFINITDNYPQNITPGQKGANRFWNFSSLVQDIRDTAVCVAPNSTPYNNFNNSANLAITNNDTNYLYFNNSNAAFKTVGTALYFDTLGSVVVTSFNPAFDLYQFPTNYNNQYSGTYSFTQELDGAAFGVNRIRIEFTSNYVDTIDAWGIVQTPVGYYEALRQKRADRSQTIVSARLQSFLPYFQISDTRDTTFDYNWLSKESKLALVDFAYDSNNVISGVTYSTRAPKPIARFTYSNTGNSFQFTNTTFNTNGTSYSWNFGDNSALNTQASPSHVYAQAGTYNVCLTATNAIGNSVYCENVTISQSCLNSNLTVALDSVQNNLCANALSGRVFITASGGTSPYNYGWSNNSTFEDIINLPGGVYTVTVTDDAGCIATQTATVTEPAILQINLDNVETPVTSTGDIDISVSGGTSPYSYLWTPNNATTQDLVNVPCDEYTLVVTDTNSCTETASITTECLVNTNNNIVEAINIYPNPAQSFFTINNLGNQISTITLYNYLGQVVLQQNIQGNEATVSFQQPKGIYLLHVKNNHINYYNKIVVE